MFLGVNIPQRGISRSAPETQGASTSGNINCTLSEVEFLENFATRGGAIAAIHVTFLLITSCNITHNEGDDGGALFVLLNSGDDPDQSEQALDRLDVENTRFEDNRAHLRGGGVSLIRNINLETPRPVGLSPVDMFITASNMANRADIDAFFDECQFVNNSASASGGAMDVVEGRVACRNSDFVGNLARGVDPSAGGAIALTRGSAFHGRQVSLAGNAGVIGGGIYAVDSVVDLVGAVISGNSAEMEGGGVHIAVSPKAALFSLIFSRINDTNCTSNEAQIGGELSSMSCPSVKVSMSWISNVAWASHIISSHILDAEYDMECATRTWPVPWALFRYVRFFLRIECRVLFSTSLWFCSDGVHQPGYMGNGMEIEQVVA